MQRNDLQTSRVGAVAERQNPSLLLAEDDPDLRALLAQTFRWRGYEVTECVDGPDLVSKLGTYLLFGPPVDFDIVISDIRMPGATALEILEAMRECEGVPPIILITAFPSDDTLDTARKLGVAAVVEKPFEIEELVKKTEAHLVAGPGVTPWRRRAAVKRTQEQTQSQLRRG